MSVIVESTYSHLFGIGMTRFVPGLNTFDDDVWAALKLHPGIKQRLAKKELRETLSGVQANAVVETQSLSKVPAVKAVELVSKTLDERLLRAWSDGETRRPVAMALRSQLKRLEGAVKVKSPEDDSASEFSDSDADDET